MTAPCKWNIVKLGALADFKNGLNYSKENMGDGMKVIGVSDFQDYSVPRYNELEQINPDGVVREADLLEEGDILFVRSNGNRKLIGRSLHIRNLKEKISHSGFTIRLRFNSDAPVCVPYYAHVFRTSLIRAELSAYGGGTNINNLNQQILNNLKVPLPPLEIQEKIASVLSAYDDLIENNRRRIEILEEMARNLYREWFVKFRFPIFREDGTIERLHAPERDPMKDSPLGLIPKDWKAKAMKELLIHNIGGGWGKDAVDDSHTVSGYVIRGTDIPQVKSGDLTACPLRYHKISNMKTREIKSGDIIFEVSGGSKGQPVGRSIIVVDKTLNRFGEKVMCASFCKLLRADKNHIQPEHMYYYLDSIYSNGEIEQYQVQSTGIINFKFQPFLEKAHIAIPQNLLENKFSNIMSIWLKEIATLGQENDILKSTRDHLLPKLISGKIDVSELDIDIPAEVS